MRKKCERTIMDKKYVKIDWSKFKYNQSEITDFNDTNNNHMDIPAGCVENSNADNRKICVDGVV